MYKMKGKILLVIVEPHMVQLKNGEVWTNDYVTAEFFKRYLNVFEKLIVCGRIRQKNDNDTTGLKKTTRPEIRFVALPDFRGIAGLLKNLPAIRKALRKTIGKADCMIYRAPSPMSMVAYPLIKACKKPFAFEMMNNPWTQYSKESINSVLQPLILRYIVWQTRDMCKTANGVSYVTEHTLQDLFPCKAMKEGDDTHFTASYSTINITREQYSFVDMPGMLPKPLVIVNSGKMNDNRKGQDTLIKAVKILRDKGYDVRLKLIGDGIMRKDFEQVAADLNVAEHVEFCGWKTGYAEVQKVLQASHVFAFPSLGEGLPRSVIEAMANGLITVASDVDGITELLSEDLMVHENTAEAFAMKLAAVIKDWEKYNHMRKETFSKAQGYESSILTKRRSTFYKQLKDCCR